jgi:hypothetical protein
LKAEATPTLVFVLASAHHVLRLASEATSARKLIDHLDQAILAKAFWGQLVRKTLMTSPPACSWSAFVPSVLLCPPRPDMGRSKFKRGQHVAGKLSEIDPQPLSNMNAQHCATYCDANGAHQ